MSAEEEALAAFQTALSELVALDLPAAETARRLATDPAFAPHRAYVTSFDLRLLESLTVVSRAHARRRGLGPRP
jgi:hypothetical protein